MVITLSCRKWWLSNTLFSSNILWQKNASASFNVLFCDDVLAGPLLPGRPWLNSLAATHIKKVPTCIFLVGILILPQLYSLGATILTLNFQQANQTFLATG